MKVNINFIKVRIPALLLSFTVIAIGLWFIFGPKSLNLGVFTPKGFNLSIDFQGGLVQQITIYSGINQDEIRSFAEHAGLGSDVQVVIIPDKNRIGKATSYLIKTIIKPAEQEAMQKDSTLTAAKLLNDRIEIFHKKITDKYGETYILEGEELKKANELYPNVITGEKVEEKTEAKRVLNNVVKESENVISPSYSAGLRLQSIFLVTFVLLIITLYVAIRFKFKFALGAIFATIHDTLVMIGFVSFFYLEVDYTIIAAILFIIGYSVNDTIVVYDRIRENVGIMKNNSTAQIINASINQTLNRTITTSLATLISVIAILIWGGPKIFGFALISSIGIIWGTYSSIYIAAPTVDLWDVLFVYKKKKIKPEFKKEEKNLNKDNQNEKKLEQANTGETQGNKVILSKKQLKKMSAFKNDKI